MEAGRQLIRYVLPGGLVILVGAIYELLYGWAWKVDVDRIIEAAKTNPVATIGGAIVIGFAIYQLYYAYYRPVVLLNIPLWGIRRLGRRLYTSDLGGAVLKSLAEDALAVAGLTHALQLKCEVAEWHWPPELKTDEQREAYADALKERSNAVRSLVNLAYNTGDVQIKRSWTELVDIYHVLGACRAALVATSFAAGVDIVAQHLSQYFDHLVRSLGVTAFVVFLFWGAWRTIRVNRRDTWLTMTAQLGNDLRIWALRNRVVLAELAKSNDQTHSSESRSAGA